MHRDWVVSHIKRLERESDPRYSWITKACNRFLNGTCTYGTNCKFGHDSKPPTQLQPPLPQLANAAALPTEVVAHDDDVEIKCLLRHSPQCTDTFTASPSYWTALVTPDGKHFAMPKSCKACRDLKRFQNLPANANTSLFASLELESHEHDDCEDDYIMAMSNKM